MTSTSTLVRRRRAPWVLTVAAAAAVLAAGPRALGQDEPAKAVETVDAGVPDDPMGVTVHRLANGITVMLSENREEPRIAAWITVRAGGAKDPADATGMAHYLEHMQFKGTNRIGTLDWEREKVHLDRITKLYDELFATTDPEKRTSLYAAIDQANQAATQYAVPSEVDHAYDAIGGQQLNANTSYDQTNYVVNIPSNRLEQWARIETERLREPVYRLFQSEIEAVYEEKNQALDNAQRKTTEALLAAAFPGHPYGTQTVLGSVEHLKNPSVTKMYEYFRTWYAPGNLCVELSGDFDKAKALDVLARTLGTLPARPVAEDPKWTLAPLKGVTRVEVRHQGDEEVMIAWRLPAESHADADALKLCDMMLANGNTGLIDVNLNHAQRVRQAGCSPWFLLEAGLQILNANPLKDQTLDEVEALLLEQVELLKKGSFTEEDLAAAITDFELHEKRNLESNWTRAGLLAEAFVQRTPWSAKVREIERLKKLKKADVVAAANAYYGADRVVVRRLNAEPDIPKMTKPGFTPVTIDSKRRSPWLEELLAVPAGEIEPKFVVKGVDVEEVPMRSGLLIHAKNPLNDVFDLTFTFPVGTDADPRLSLAFGLLDLGGAGDLDGVALKRKLYALGSKIGGGAGRDECVVTVSGLDANLPATLDLLREHFAKPTGVAQADLAKLVDRVLAGRKAQKDAPPGVAAALAEYARRGAESAFLVQPTNDELATWKAEDLLAAARDVWKLRRTVSYVGRLGAEAVAKAVDLAPIGGTHEQLVDAPPRKPVAYFAPGKNTVLFVDQAMSQAQVQMVLPDGAFDPKSSAFTRVYNEYMSGSMGSVVFQEIRESRSLAYDPATMYRAPTWREDENLMIGQMRTQADKCVEAVEAMLGLIRRMPASPDRFEKAVRAVDLSYRTTRLGFRRNAELWLTWKRQGYGGDPRPDNWARAKAMKLEDLVAWTKRFEGAGVTVAVTGPKGTIDLEALKKFGDVREMKADELFAW